MLSLTKSRFAGKSLVFISLVLLLTGLAFAQQYKPYNTFNKEAELQNFVEHGGKVEEISPNVYRLTNPIGESRTFYLGSKENVLENKEGIDTTIINVWEIDTTKFAGLFTFWQQVQVANFSWAPLPVEDLNNNNRPELYGFTDVINPNLAGPVKIFERNTNGIFQDIFSYDLQTAFVKGIADINGDGNAEILIVSIEDEDSTIFTYPFYKSDSAGSLPTTFDFFFYLDNRQINDVAFGDWDNNGKTDCAFTVALELEPPMCVIAEYRDSINNFKELFRLLLPLGSDVSGFAIDDFDQDENNELVISSGAGIIYVIENKFENEYSLVNQFSFPTFNAYMQTATKDIDENGKREFWIGGQNFVEGITVFQCYESDGDNSYKAVARIELRYLTSLSGSETIQAVDIDDDSKEELIISIGNVILILKFVGSPNNHQYNLWYAKLGEATQPGAEFYPVAVADLDGDGKKDLLIPMSKYTPSIIYKFSYILRKEKPSAITESEIKWLSFETVQGYPNPFNSESIISFNINETSNVQLKIYNTLGKEINILLNEELSPGKYDIIWDAKDKLGNSLPSGVYLIVLKTKNSVKTFKSILLK
jgi:hypothetical protein